MTDAELLEHRYEREEGIEASRDPPFRQISYDQLIATTERCPFYLEAAFNTRDLH